MRISTRVFLGYGGMLLLMAGLAMAAVQQVTSISASLGVINDINSVKQRYAIDLRGSVHDRAIAVRDVVLVSAVDDREAAIAEIVALAEDYARASQGMAAMVADPAQTSDEEREILDRIAETEAQTVPLIDEIIRLHVAGDWIQSQFLLMDQARPLFVQWLAEINAFIDLQEANNQAEGVHVRSTADGFQLFMLGVFGVALLVALGLGAWTISSIRPLRSSTDIMLRLADGDLTVDVPETKDRNEIGAIMRSLAAFKAAAVQKQAMESRQAEQEQRAEREKRTTMNQLADAFEQRVEAVVGTVSSSAERLVTLAKTLSTLTGTAEQRAQAVESAVAQTSANVSSVSESVQSLSQSIAGVADRARESTAMAGDAKQRADNAGTTAGKLSEAAGKIGDVVNLISDIAEQTNLLALNATIEAARAGEAGKGFAVVASEVKSLATQTAKATDDIALQINGMRDSTDEVVRTIDQIQAVIGSLNDQAHSIAEAVKEQHHSTEAIAVNTGAAAEGAQAVTSNIGDVASAVSESGSGSQSVLDAATALSEQAHNLRSEVSAFVGHVRTA